MGLCLIYDIAFIFSFEFLYEDNSRLVIFAEVLNSDESGKYIIKDISKNTKLILYTNIHFIPGDILKIDGEFCKAERARNYKGFDYNNYLKQRKIYGILKSNNISKIKTNKDIYYIKGKIINRIIKEINKLYNEEIGGFLEAILFGYKTNVDENFKENFKFANISHVLAISGMHISFVIYIISSILKKIFKNKKLENYILIIFIIGFCFITGNSISSIRATIMTIISILSFNFYRKYNFFISYFLSFFIVIILNPFNFFNIGMWLSYLGILGIKLFFNFYEKIIFHKIKVHETSRIVIKTLILSISAQILIFPIVIYNFNILSFNFLLSNILVFLFIDKIMILGYLSLFLSLINNNICLFISNINIFLINIFMYLIEKINKIPFSKIYIKTPYLITIILYYIIIFISCIYYKRNKHCVLRLFCSLTCIQIKVKRMIYKIKKASYLVIIVVIASSIQVNKIFNDELNVCFVDVGQGDCTLIKTPKNKTILVDSGEGNFEKYDYGKNVVLPYLLDRRINKLDYIIISHFDSDHVRRTFLYYERNKSK